MGGAPLSGKLITGWFIVTLSYFVTFAASAYLFRLLFQEPIDLGRPASGVFMGCFMIVIPYIVAGLYSRSAFDRPTPGAFWVSFVPMISERGLIYLIGAQLVASGGDGSMEGITTMMFIQGEAAPYYTVPYILLGVLSVLLAMIISRSKQTAVPSH